MTFRGQSPLIIGFINCLVASAIKFLSPLNSVQITILFKFWGIIQKFFQVAKVFLKRQKSSSLRVRPLLRNLSNPSSVVIGDILGQQDSFSALWTFSAKRQTILIYVMDYGKSIVGTENVNGSSQIYSTSLSLLPWLGFERFAVFCCADEAVFEGKAIVSPLAFLLRSQTMEVPFFLFTLGEVISRVAYFSIQLVQQIASFSCGSEKYSFWMQFLGASTTLSRTYL